jgi:hypothetical protein
MDQAIILFVGATLIALGVVMQGTRAGYWVFVVGVRAVLLLAIILATVAWYMSSAHAETDHRTPAEKAFCAGVEIQRMTAEISLQKYKLRLKRAAIRFM